MVTLSADIRSPALPLGVLIREGGQAVIREAIVIIRQIYTPIVVTHLLRRCAYLL